MKRNIGILGLLILLPVFCIAHEGHHHPKDLVQSHQEKFQASSKIEREVLQRINESYLKTVKPVFIAKCIACHGIAGESPWYANMPGVRALIEKDKSDAKRHLDMTEDFPFGGHGSFREDLDEIKRTTIKNTMPPRRFTVLHPDSKLSESEKMKIISWVEESQKLLPNLSTKGAK